MPGQLQIERSRASTSVHHQHESRRISNGRLRLLENFARDGSMVVGQQTSRIDDFERPAAPGSSAVNTIASNSRLVCDNRPASSRRSEEHTSELQSRGHLVCRLLLEKKKSSPSKTHVREWCHTSTLEEE